MRHLDFHPRCQVEDLATPYLRGEAELRGEGRDGLEPVRRRVNPATPGPRPWKSPPAQGYRPGQRARAPTIRPRLRFSATVSARAPYSSAIRSNSPAVKAPRLSGRIVTVLGLALARSVREIEGDAGRVVFLEVAQGMAEDLSMS